jgi:hypothetical protein
MTKNETFRTLRLMADLSMEVPEGEGWHRALCEGTPIRDLIFDREVLPTITLYEPWATLIVLGEKWIETRGWKTNYRGPIGIHAGTKNLVWKATRILEGMYEDGWRARRAFDPSIVAPGHLLGVAELVDCVPMGYVEEPDPHHLTRMGKPSGEPDFSTPSYDYFTDPSKVILRHTRETYVGDFGPGRFAWLLDRPRRFVQPIPCRGWQRIWKKQINRSVLTIPAE